MPQTEIKLRQDLLKAEQTKNEAIIDKENWNPVNKPKLERVKRICEQLVTWLVMTEDNDLAYETKSFEFEMLQLEKEYLQDEVDDCNKIINREAKTIKEFKKRLETYRSESKTSSNSVYTKID